MPRILVSDTNIWIDFHRADLLNAVFRLPYAFCTTDFVKAELTTPGMDYMISLGLTIYSLDGNEIKQLYGLCQSFNNSSLADVSCLFLANALNCPLLTGDGRLRSAGEQKTVSATTASQVRNGPGYRANCAAAHPWNLSSRQCSATQGPVSRIKCTFQTCPNEAKCSGLEDKSAGPPEKQPTGSPA